VSDTVRVLIFAALAVVFGLSIVLLIQSFNIATLAGVLAALAALLSVCTDENLKAVRAATKALRQRLKI